MANNYKCDPCEATGIGALGQPSTPGQYGDAYNPTNSLVENSVRFQEILNPLYAQGRVLETWGQYEEFLRYETIFFDVVPQKDPTTGEVYVTYKFKDGLAASGEMTLLDSECKVGWYEPRICGEETKVTAYGEDGGLKYIEVEDITKLGGVDYDSTLLVTLTEDAGGNPINGLYIDHIDGNGRIYFKNTPNTEIVEGSRVRRGAYLRDIGCDTSIHNPIALGGMDYYSAFFRTISISHEFNWCDLNKDYLVSGGMQAIVDAMFRKGDVEAIKEFLHAAFYDRNMKIADHKWETMGLFPALAKAQEGGLRIAFDLSKCCDQEASECTNARHQIQAFLDIVINKAMVSGMYKNNVTVAMNKKAMEALHMMQGYFQDYGNVGFLDGSQWDIDVGLPRIRYAGTVLTFKYLPILNDFNYSVMLTIPEEKVGVFQAKYTVVDTNGKLVGNAPINGSISRGTPMLRYIPQNPYGTGAQLGECNTIVGDVKFAVVWMGVDKGAYRLIKDFGKCVINGCDTCAIEDTDFLSD